MLKASQPEFSWQKQEGQIFQPREHFAPRTLPKGNQKNVQDKIFAGLEIL